MIAATGCGERSGDQPSTAAEASDTPRFEGGASSLEDLADAVVLALTSSDTAGLEAIRFTETEHNQLIWPHFPAAQQDPPFPVDLAWENIQIRNSAAIETLIPRFEGREFVVTRASCAGGEEEFPTFRVLRGCEIVVVEPSGVERTINPFLSAVMMDGRLKIVRYDRG
jgi:hypothetical protein